MVRAGAVRRLLRRTGPGLLRGRVPRRRDPRGRRRHRAPAAARRRRGRLRDRVGAQGARQPRGRRQHRRHRPDLPALGHAAGVVQGQGHHRRRPTSPARRSATGASATSTRSSPRSTRPVSIRRPTSRSCTAVRHARPALRRHRRGRGHDVQRVRAGARGREPRHRRAVHAGRLQRRSATRTSGVGMLQDAIWADAGRARRTTAYATSRSRFVAASLARLGVLPRQPRVVHATSSSPPARSSATATSCGR